MGAPFSARRLATTSHHAFEKTLKNDREVYNTCAIGIAANDC